MNTQTIPRFGRRGRTAPTDQGFTLIELVVVVIIIGILAAIAIPIFMNQRARGHDAQVTAQVRHVVDAIETAMIDSLGAIDGSHTAGSVTIGAATVTVPTTDGVRWIATGAGLEYCVSGWHDDTNRYTSSTPLIWDSAAGGFLPPGAPCGSGTPGNPDPGDPGDGGGGGGGPLPPGEDDAGYDTLISFTYDFDAPGCTDTSMTLPLVGVAGDAQVDWGDGSVGAYTAHHHYWPTGTYTATVTDATFTGIDVGLAWDRQACLVSVDAWEGDTGPVDLSFAFEGAVNLKSVATPPVPITGMAGAFMGASSFNQDLSGWDTSQVTDFGGVFAGASAFNGDVSGWDTSSATTMNAMFSHASSFNQDLSGWDTSNVTDMSSMFLNATAFNGDVSTWDTSSVSNFYGTFEGASSFNRDLSGWDLASAESVALMFFYASSFNQDLSGWDVAHIWDAWGFDDGAVSWEPQHKPSFS